MTTKQLNTEIEAAEANLARVLSRPADGTYDFEQAEWEAKELLAELLEELYTTNPRRAKSQLKRHGLWIDD